MLIRTYYEPDDLVSIRNLKTIGIDVANSFDDHEYERIMQMPSNLHFVDEFNKPVIEDSPWDLKNLDDNSSKYTSKMLKQLCHTYGIRQQFTAPYTSFQNGVAER